LGDGGDTVTRTSPPQFSFSSGEIDPLLHRRNDYQRFQSGLATCRGFLPLAQGGFTRAPGTLHRGQTFQDRPAVLVPFVFADNDAMVLEFTNLRLRFWRYGALIESAPGVPYEIASPYNTAALENLRWKQSADVIYLCDGSRPVHRLARQALDSWTLDPLTFDSGPFRVQNLTKSRTLQASDVTGSITLTASWPLWQAGHVGSLIMLTATDLTAVPLWTSSEAVAVNQRRRYENNIYRLTMTTGPDVGTNPPIHLEGEALSDNDTKWKFLSDEVGIVRITSITSGTVAQAEVLRTLSPGCVDDPTYRWSEGAWSDIYGYPAALEMYDQRLVFAATASEPRSIWFSTVADFSDFLPGTEADAAFAYTLSGEGSINRILNLRQGRNGLHIFALGEEYSTRAESRGQVIGPTNAVFGLDGSMGASLAQPIAPYGDPVFISRDKGSVVQIAYAAQSDANEELRLSRPSQHLGAEGFEQLVWQNAPEPMAWVRRSSGDLAAMLYDPSEQVLGWAVVSVADGFVRSLVVTPEPNGRGDIVTLCVRRTIGGAPIHMIEELAPIYGVLNGTEPLTAAVHLYSAIQWDLVTPRASFNIPHLEGRQVYAWTDQGEFGPFVVPTAAPVVLPVDVSQATIGLFDDSHYVETLDVQAAIPDGHSAGRQKRILSGCAVALHRTGQLEMRTVERDFGVPPRVSSPVHKLVPRGVALNLTAAFSGWAKAETPGGNAREVALRFYPYHGAPATVLAVVPTVKEGG
jgi:hypothetical protein